MRVQLLICAPAASVGGTGQGEQSHPHSSLIENSAGVENGVCNYERRY